MKRTDYLKRVFEAYETGRISEEAYDAALENTDAFCDDDDEED